MFNIRAGKTNLCFKTLLALIFCAGFVLCAYAEDSSAQRSLDLGKRLYESGKFNQAMDQFVNVFVEGNSEQIAEANEYMNLIHYAAGNVEETIVPSQQVGVPQEEETVNPASKQDDVLNAKTPQGDYGIGALASPYVLDPATGKVVTGVVKEQIIVQDGMPVSDPEQLKAQKKNEVDHNIYEQITSAAAKLSKTEGVNVYTRDGFIDAIDIDAKLIFGNTPTTFTPQSADILDLVYNLMILNGRPSFVLLPPGSYSDNVTINGVRQAAALNSYFISKGISTGKLRFNMGLSAEEPPLKFSDLNGLSVVFDYTSVPQLKNNVADKNTPPILSIGMYPEDGFYPEKGEGMVIDFSVIQAASPIKNWTFQIIRHAGDNKFFVIRQITGTKAAYRQIYWNGKKEYFGPMLPFGKYTLILIANDEQGRQKIVRRPISLLPSADQLKYYTEAAAVAGPKKAEAQKSDLNYQSPRLWTKPQRTMVTPYNDEEAAQDEDAQAAKEEITSDDVLAGSNEISSMPAPAVANQDAAQSADLGSSDTASAVMEDNSAADTAADPNASADQYEDIPDKQ